jgi:phage terminase large subunit GpA-like protein
MGTCEVCGNRYDKAFQVQMNGKSHTFDSFECAIHKLAPVCTHCQCKIVGHGVEVAAKWFCCSHCAEQSGAQGTRDRVG